MGRFWGDASESSDSENSSVSEEEKVVAQAPKKTEKAWVDYDDASSSEEDRRVVRSEKDKRWDALRECIKKMNQHKRSQDYVELFEDFALLEKLVSKSLGVIESEGAPNFLVRALVDLTTYVEEKHKDKAGLKKCSKGKAQAINKLQRKMPKSLELFKIAIEQCVEDPAAFASEEDSESSSSSDASSESESSNEDNEASDSDSADGEDESSSSSNSSSNSDSSGSDSESSSSSDSDSSSSSDSESSSASSVASVASSASEADFEARHARAMIKWGYKTPAQDDKEKKDAKRQAAEKRRLEAERRKALKDKLKADEEEAGVISGATEARRSSVLLPDGDAMDEEAMAAKVREVTADRNKRGAERLEQVEILRRLSQLAAKKDLPHIQAEILGFLTTFGLDSVQASGIPPTVTAWQQVFEDLWQLMLLLSKNQSLKVKLGNVALDAESNVSETDVLTGTAAMLMSYLERLDDHLMRSLQACDAHVKEYQDRMHHALSMIGLLWVALAWFNRQQAVHGKPLPEVWRTSLRLVEHMYYVPDRIATMQWAVVKKKLEGALSEEKYGKVPIVPSETVAELCREVFTRAPPNEHRALFRAQVTLVYSMALHDQYYQARDLFNGGNLYDVAMSQDVNEQILYNRGLTQIGLAAFRKGLISAAVTALSDICGANKQRELLAQGVAVVKGFEKTVEQEKAERRRLLPSHMHINLDLVESAYNICSMLLEVPSLCGPDASLENRQRQSRFKRALDLFEKSNVLPESSREIIMTAAKALQLGCWEKCQEHIFSLRCWNYLQPEGSREAVQQLISQKIKETGLRSYVLSYAHLYDAISVDRVSEMFDLSKSVVYSLVSKMMINREVSAFWDAGSETILVTKTTPTRLQLAALNVADGIGSAVEQAESMFAAPANSQQNRRAQKSR